MIGIVNYGSGNVQAIANIYNRTNILQYAYTGGRQGTINKGIINGIKNSWCIKPIALETLDFKFNVPWKIILKTRITSISSPVIEFCIDPLSDALGDNVGRYIIQFGNELGSEFGRFTDNDVINNIFTITNDFFTKMHAKKRIHAFVCSTDCIRRYKHVAPRELF